MLNVTEKARMEIDRYFEDKDVQPIRIFLNQGCGGPQFAMAVDAPRSEDKEFKLDGYTYLIDKDLLVKAQPIKVDFNEYGFEISSALELGGGCGGCCGSCGSDQC
jgi:Fe-S cluster assembly iron-binding protein IscA